VKGFTNTPQRGLRRALGVSLSLLFVACQGVEQNPPLATTSESAVVNVRVAASSDDAEEGASGKVYRTSTDLELTYDGSSQTVGLRFVKVAVPQGATILNAHIQFKTDETTSVSTPLTIRGQAADNAPTFSSTSKNVSSRKRTAASVAWSPPTWKKVGEVGLNQRTPNLAPAVQEVVNRPGWASGNALAFIIKGKGKRVAEAFDGDRAGAPLLRIEYTVPVVNQPPTVKAGADQTLSLPSSAALKAEVTDDGLPEGALSVLWSQVSGPGTATFAESGAAQTTASFSEMGSYVLRLTASDGVLSASDEVSVTVQDESTPITVVAAGDIACSPSSRYFNGGLGTSDKCRQKYTADLIGQLGADAVLTLGDNQYEEGTLEQFMTSYDPSWGQYKGITYPSVGNHEYRVPGAADYYTYFGARAGDPSRGYYSFDLGGWHIIALNSNCGAVGGCEAGSEQERWLRADLAAHPTTCTLAYWHHPLFSSGSHGNDPATTDFWRALYEAGAELVLVGHDHNYERFAPQTPDGVADPEKGIRQFVVGTGGKNHYSISAAQPNSEVRDGTTHGVLKLDLREGGYDWAFVPEVGGTGTFTDSGRASCY